MSPPALCSSGQWVLYSQSRVSAALCVVFSDLFGVECTPARLSSAVWDAVSFEWVRNAPGVLGYSLVGIGGDCA